LPAALCGAEESGCVLISPVPGYVHSRCCEDGGHVNNLNEVDLDEEIAFGLEDVKRLLHIWATENNLLYNIIDPTMLNDSCDLGLKTRGTSTGQRLWGENDLVHLVPEGYRDLAGIVSGHIRASAEGDTTSLSDLARVAPA
jgi:hypothetical protein